MPESTSIIRYKSETIYKTRSERLEHGMNSMEMLYVTEFIVVCLAVIGVFIIVLVRYLNRSTFDQMSVDSENDALLANNFTTVTNNHTTPNGIGTQEQHTPLLLELDESSQGPTQIHSAVLQPSLDFQSNIIISNHDDQEPD